MSSTDLDAPPLKLILAAIIIVVGLHVLTAVALVAIKAPEIKVEPKKETPPIEIEMVSLPPSPPVEIEERKVEEEKPKPVRKPETKPRAKPAVAAKPKPVRKLKPIEKFKPAIKPVVTSENPKTKTQPNTIKAAGNKPFEHEVKPQGSISAAQADALAADNERKILAAKAEKAEQARADAKKAQEIADAKAKAEADARDKAAAQAAAAASNEPVSFTAGDAEMIKTPRFSIPDSVLRRAKTGDTFNVLLKVTVDKQGRVSDVLLVGKSGNSIVDKEAVKKMHSARFRPFIKNGVPVVGVVTLPVSHVVD